MRVLEGLIVEHEWNSWSDQSEHAREIQFSVRGACWG